MALKNLGDNVYKFDDTYDKVRRYVIVGCDGLVSSYIVVEINKNLREKDLKFDKMKWDAVYDSEKEAKEAYIRALEKARDEQNQLFNDRILKLRGVKKND